MANLKDIIGSIMRDVIIAQHQANLFSQSLSDSYKASGRTSGFTLPAVALGEMEMDIRYGISGGLQEIEEEDIDYQETNRMLHYISTQSSNLLIKMLVKCIQASKVDYRGGGFDFIDRLCDNQKYIRHLDRRLFAILTIDVDTLMTDKKFDEFKVGKAILQAADDIILMDMELKDLFDLGGGSALRTHIKAKFEEAVTGEVDDFIRECSVKNFLKTQRFGSLNVEIDADALSGYPDSAASQDKDSPASIAGRRGY